MFTLPLLTLTMDSIITVSIAVGGVILSMIGWLVVKILQMYERKLSEAVAEAKNAQKKAEEAVANAERRANEVERSMDEEAKDLEARLTAASTACKAVQDAEHKLLHQRISEEARLRAADWKVIAKDVSDAMVTAVGVGASHARRDEMNNALDKLRDELNRVRDSCRGSHE